jgi:dynein heavy chain
MFPKGPLLHVQVEEWMGELEKSVKLSVANHVLRCLDGYDKMSYRKWMNTHPTQMVLTVQHILWTKLVHKGILDEEKYNQTLVASPPKGLTPSSSLRMPQRSTKRPLAETYKQLTVQLEGLVGIITKTVGKMTALQRIRVSSVTIQEAHGKEVVEALVAQGVDSTKSFLWLRQLRMYLDNHGDVIIRNMNSALKYACEYVGSASRLVITPLTERCYVTCISAMWHQYGAGPEGPAGTGKTETVKDLSKVCGQFCLVFNCSEGVDVFTMARFFRGLMQVGAWSCFDEFNRIPLDVLSVVAQQILTINQGLGMAASRVNSSNVLGVGNPTEIVFEGGKVNAKPSFATFITLNPTYRGRAQLPENLRTLFRPVAMMVPDFQLIAQVSLYCSGFSLAQELANKMVTCMRLSAEILSSQEHYDFSMRNLKTVLQTAEEMMYLHLSRKNAKAKELARAQAEKIMNKEPSAAFSDKNELDFETEEMDEEESKESIEQRMCLRACSKSNIPMLTDADLAQYNQILVDLFTDGQKIPKRTDMDALVATIREVVGPLGLQAQPHFVKRCVHLYNMMEVRHGVMILGGAGVGKTSCLRALRAALMSLSQQGLKANSNNAAPETPVHLLTISPKALSMDHLYGYVDPLSRDWTDGVIAKCMREMVMVADERQDRHWLVLDGSVDNLWVENLNTLLDNSKKLCLTSGETIMLTPGSSIVFEVEDLTYVSPATVSRCGMVFLDGREVGWEPLMAQWLNQLPPVLENYKHKLTLMFELLVTPSLEFTEERVRRLCAVPEEHLVSNFIQLYDCHLADVNLLMVDMELNRNRDFQIVLESLFIFCLVHTIGQVVAMDHRIDFSDFFSRLCESAAPESVLTLGRARVGSGRQLHRQKFHLSKPLPGDVYKYYFNVETLEWTDWRELWSGFNPPPSADSHLVDLMVPTQDTCARSYIFEVCMRHLHHTAFLGPTATGKTLSIKTYLKAQMGEAHEEDGDEVVDYDDDNNGETVEKQMSVWPIKLVMSPQMELKDVKGVLESNLTRKGNRIYGPQPGRRCIVFVDDVQVAKSDEFGNQASLELLRQWLDHKGWYFSSGTDFCSVVDLLLVAGLTLSSANALMGSADMAALPLTVSQRYLRHHQLIITPELTDAGMKTIYHAYTDSVLPRKKSSLNFMLKGMVDMTVKLYLLAKERLLPVPSRPHYMFNMRHVEKVMLAMFHVPAVRHSELPQKDTVWLWAHECTRVFADGLLDLADREWIKQTLHDLLVPFVKKQDAVYEEDLKELDEPYLYCNFLRVSTGDEFVQLAKQDYLKCRDMELLTETVAAYVKESGRRDHKNITQVVLFEVACRQVAVLARVLDTDYHGHCLHVGQAGCGRRTLTTLASYIVRSKMYTVEMKPDYNGARWREDLKEALHWTGVTGNRTTLMVVDSPLIPEVVIDNLSHLVSNGEIPGLYTGDDWHILLDTLVPILQVEEETEQREQERLDGPGAFQPKGGDIYKRLEELFIRRCRQHLRVVFLSVALSGGGLLQQRMRRYPMLGYHMTAQALAGWDTEACNAVARVICTQKGLDKEVINLAVPACADIHQSAVQAIQAATERTGFHAVVTIADYMELLHGVSKQLIQKRTHLQNLCDKYKRGVAQMANLSEKVSV